MNVETHVVQGDVAATIVRLASEFGCNQIVMGSHGRTGLTGLLMGSVASKVMHLAQIPITFIKPRFLCTVQRRCLSSGCETRPATFAPAGSNWSSHGGNEVAEASGVEGSEKGTWRPCRP